MPDNEIGWGQGAVNNNNDWGKAKANSTNNFGAVYDSSPSGDTNIAGGQPVVSITYSASAFCADASDPTPTIRNNAGAGTFSSTTGLVFISTSTGQVDVSASTAGTYTITYTDTDSAVATFSLTVNALPTVTVSSSAGTICNGESTTLTASGASTYVWNDGNTDNPRTVSPTTTTTFTATGTDTNGCSSSGSTSITVNAQDSAAFSYAASAFCANGTDPTPTITGTVGGAFTSTAGLVINSGTGEIDLDASTAGTYSVTYTTTGVCSDSQSANITINALDNAAFTYSASSYQQDDSDPTPTVTGLTGGTFSAGSGLVFVDSGTNTGSSTGEIDLSASTIASYTITYDTTSSGSSVCPNTSTQTVEVASSFSNVYSVELDGVNDYVSFTQTNFLNSDNEASFSFWIKPDTYGGSSNYGYIIGGSSVVKGGFGYSEGGTAGSHSAGQLYYFNGQSGGSRHTGVVLTQNVWSHVVFVFETGGVLKTYKNGSLSNTLTGISFTTNSNFFSRIGHLGGTSHYVNGKIDEFAIWSSALTASNVSTIYNSGTPNDISSLSPVLWYRFEEGSGTSVADSGSGSLTGTLTNGATFSTDVP